MSILVTGASGFIGSSVTAALVSNGADVVVLTRHALPKMEHVVQVTCDLGGHIDMTTLETIKEQPITAVVHCAAVTPWAKDADYSLDIQMAQKFTTNIQKQRTNNQTLLKERLCSWHTWDCMLCLTTM